MKRSAPVDFRWLRQSVDVAELEARHCDNPDDARRILRQILPQLDLYAPADRDRLRGFRQLVEIAIEHPASYIHAVGEALDEWVYESATAFEKDAAHRAMMRHVSGKTHGGKTKRDASDRQSEWIAEARKMRGRNPRRSPADMAKALAAEPGETASAGWIAKVLRKGL